MRDTAVLHPGLGVGHLGPTMELAKLFLQRGLAVTVVLVGGGPGPDPSSAGINFHVLPLPHAAPDASPSEPAPFGLLRRANAPLRDYLRSVLPSVRALVLDMFCLGALDVAEELGVPAYLFYTSCASSLAVNMYLPHLQAQVNAGLREIGDELLSFPGVPPFKPTELPVVPRKALDHDSEMYKAFMCVFDRLAAPRGILVNTFEWLEATAVGAIRGGACVPGRPMPPVYCVGPLVTESGEKKQQHECLAWLDAQPVNSVVFLCFGSMGSFPKTQLEAIAAGLEMSGKRFLWVVRSPRRGDFKLFADELIEPDLDELLPEGFLERTKGRGLVAKSWAPQADVLRHKATAAFVTHCGWNSVLEGITAGVPLLCWPLYAEQGVNKVMIVEEGRLGLEMAGFGCEDVTAEEVESKVRRVMELAAAGQPLRQQATEAKEMASKALEHGGASHNDLLEFLRDVDGV